MDPRSDFVPILIDGQEWKICFDMNALAAFQEKQGKSIARALYGIDIDEVLDSTADKVKAGIKLLADIDFSDLRAAWWCTLLRYHEGISLEAAGRLIHQGNFTQILESIGSAVKPFFPDSEESGEERRPLD